MEKKKKKHLSNAYIIINTRIFLYAFLYIHMCVYSLNTTHFYFIFFFSEKLHSFDMVLLENFARLATPEYRTFSQFNLKRFASLLFISTFFVPPFVSAQKSNPPHTRITKRVRVEHIIYVRIYIGRLRSFSSESLCDFSMRNKTNKNVIYLNFYHTRYFQTANSG